MEENQNKLISHDSWENISKSEEKINTSTWFSVLIGPTLLFLMVTCDSAIPPIVNEMKTGKKYLN